MLSCVMVIHISFKVYTIPVCGYLGIAKFIDLSQLKGDNSCIAEASRAKLNMH